MKLRALYTCTCSRTGGIGCLPIALTHLVAHRRLKRWGQAVYFPSLSYTGVPMWEQLGCPNEAGGPAVFSMACARVTGAG